MKYVLEVFAIMLMVTAIIAVDSFYEYGARAMTQEESSNTFTAHMHAVSMVLFH